jgi:hypothetical protein
MAFSWKGLKVSALSVSWLIRPLRVSNGTSSISGVDAELGREDEEEGEEGGEVDVWGESKKESSELDDWDVWDVRELERGEVAGREVAGRDAAAGD